MTEDLKAFLKSRLSAQYDGDVKTGDPFSLGLDVAQLQVSVGCGNAKITHFEGIFFKMRSILDQINAL